MALLPANVLVGDSSADWLKIAIPLVLQHDLMGSASISPSIAADESNATQQSAQSIVRTQVESRSGKFHVTATLVDTGTQKTTGQFSVDAGSKDELVASLNSLAKKIDSQALEFSTKRGEVLELFAGAARQPNPQMRAQMLDRALTLDPSFGFGYFLMLQMLAPAGPEHLKPLIDKAQSQSASFTPYDRARLELVRSQLSRAPLDQRSAAAEAVLKVAPNDIDALSVIGGIRFIQGNANGGAEILNRALTISPNNSSVQAQLIQGYVQNRRFADAEKLLSSLQNNPAILPELASCILLQGDVTRADQVAERYLKTVENDSFRILMRASWLTLSGRRTQGISTVETATFNNPNIKASALSEAAIWQLLDKDYAGARRSAELALHSDDHPSGVAMVASLLADGQRPVAEWRQQVQASSLSDPVKQPVIAYGLFLNGHYAEAAVEWKRHFEQSDGMDLRSRAMTAASLDRAGNAAEAGKMNVRPFLIGDFADVYGAISFTEMRRLTGLTGK